MYIIYFRFIFYIFLVAFCTVPTLAHGSVTPLQSCPNGQCGVGARVRFSCESAYHLSGNSLSHCIGYGRWDPAIPTCEGKSAYTTSIKKLYTEKPGMYSLKGLWINFLLITFCVCYISQLTHE